MSNEFMPRLVLASESKARKYLLDKITKNYIAVAPRIDERQHPGEVADEMVIRLAQQKVSACIPDYPHHWIIGCDQVCVYNGKCYGKPQDLDTAFDYLHEFSGKSVSFINGLCVYYNEKWATHLHETEVKYRILSDKVIKQYLHKESPLDCAGALKSEGLGITLVAEINSTDPFALIGLPLIALTGLLQLLEYDFLD